MRPANVESPEYSAVIEWGPAAKVDVLNARLRAAVQGVCLPMETAPSK